MSDPNVYLVTAVSALVGLGMLIYAALNGWRGWLQLKHQQLSHDVGHHAPAAPSAAAQSGARV